MFVNEAISGGEDQQAANNYQLFRRWVRQYPQQCIEWFGQILINNDDTVLGLEHAIRASQPNPRHGEAIVAGFLSDVEVGPHPRP